MKKYGIIEPFIVECKRARSYVVVHDIGSILVAVIGLILGIVAKSIGIFLVIFIIDAIQAVCYHLSVETTVLGVTRHFIGGHIGVLRSRDAFSPMSHVVGLTRYSSFFERIAGATTVIVSVPGQFRFKYQGMDAASVDKLFEIYQKYVLISERNASMANNSSNGG